MTLPFHAVLAEVRIGDFTLSIDGWDTAVAIIAICSVGIVVFAVGLPILFNIVQTRAREKTKREIAAYVAEGSIKPEHAAELIRAGANLDAARSWRKVHHHTEPPQENTP